MEIDALTDLGQPYDFFLSGEGSLLETETGFGHPFARSPRTVTWTSTLRHPDTLRRCVGVRSSIDQLSRGDRASSDLVGVQSDRPI